MSPGTFTFTLCSSLAGSIVAVVSFVVTWAPNRFNMISE